LAEIRYLSNPPIREAVFGINFGSIVEVNSYESLVPKLKYIFPNSTKKTSLFGFSEGTIKPEFKNSGFFLANKERNETLELDSSGIVYGIKGNYESWDKSFSVFEDVLKIFKENIENSDLLIKFITVKFENRMNFDKNEYENLESGLKFKPIVTYTDNRIYNYFLNVNDKVDDQMQSSLAIRLHECRRDSNKLHLDTIISVFKLKNTNLNLANLKSEFNDLRKLKNKIFFSSFDDQIINQYA